MQKQAFTQENLQEAISRLIAQTTQKVEETDTGKYEEQIAQLKRIIQKLAERLQQKKEALAASDHEASPDKIHLDRMHEEVEKLKQSRDELLEKLKEQTDIYHKLNELEEENTRYKEEIEKLQEIKDPDGLFEDITPLRLALETSEKKQALLLQQHSALRAKIETLEEEQKTDKTVIANLRKTIESTQKNHEDHEGLIRKTSALEEELQEHKIRLLHAINSKKELEEELEAKVYEEALVHKKLEKAKDLEKQQDAIIQELEKQIATDHTLEQSLEEKKATIQILEKRLEEAEAPLQALTEKEHTQQQALNEKEALLEKQHTHMQQVEKHLAKRVKECALLNQKLEESKQKAAAFDKKESDLKEAINQLQTTISQKEKVQKTVEAKHKKTLDDMQASLEKEQEKYKQLIASWEHQKQKIDEMSQAQQKLEQFQTIFGQFGKLLTPDDPQMPPQKRKKEEKPVSFFETEQPALQRPMQPPPKEPTFFKKDLFT